MATPIVTQKKTAKVGKPKKTSADVVATAPPGLWKECPSYPGVYVTENADILLPSGKVSEARPNRQGYILIDVAGKKIGRSTLIADTYLPPDSTKPEVDHINQIRDDDRLCNLRRCTKPENMNNRTMPKRIQSKSVAQYENGELVRVWPSAWSAAEGLSVNINDAYNVKQIYNGIQHCCCGNRQKSAKGFGWKWVVVNIPNEQWKSLTIKTKDKGKIQILVSNKARIDYGNEIRLGSLMTSGYVATKIGGTSFQMHTLVCRAFHGEPLCLGMTPDHIDRNRINNDASNLRWATGSQQQMNKGVINRCGQTSALISIDKNGKEVYYINVGVASRAINIPPTTIHYCIKQASTTKKTGLRFRHATVEEIGTNTTE